VGNGDTIELCVKDRPALASDFIGISFEPCTELEVMTLKTGQSLNLTVKFNEHLASKHARYCKCAAVGMQKIDNEGRHKITFETIDDSDPKAMMTTALDALETRVDNALLDLSRSDVPAPISMC
tara:strand:- start:74 stop:445 length:372 start_codon:yes stop_codon:yes gene_type:complete